MASVHPARFSLREPQRSVASQVALLDKGTFLVSVDTEMAWGAVDKPLGYLYECEAERRCIDRLIALMDAYEISGTWALVGHLFLESCQPANGVKHPEIIRARYSWRTDDWFRADPCTDVVRAPTWYAPDVVNRLVECPTYQEIASHSFSHLLVGETGCSAEAFRSELQECLRLAAERGISLRSFVFPKNLVGHLPVLRDNGFRAYRGQRSGAPSAWPVINGVGASVHQFRDLVLLRKSSAVYPELTDGVWNLPSTYLFTIANRRRTYQVRMQQALRRLRHAAKHRTLFHLWFHPQNLAVDPEVAFAGLERLFREARRLRDRQELTTTTMGELAAHLDADLPAPLPEAP